MTKYLTKEINLIVKDPRDSTLQGVVNENLAELSDLAESGSSIFELIDIKYHTQFRASENDMVHSALIIYAYHPKSELVE